MIIALGIDAVEIERFEKWHLYSRKQLHRVFSQQELNYCLAIKEKSAERFGVRYAAKEAFFKALCQAHPKKLFSLMQVIKSCEMVKRAHGAPELYIDWHALNVPKAQLLVSLTHTSRTAWAAVVMQALENKFDNREFLIDKGSFGRIIRE
jgi:holo-[acyl-carrier protein] synthase